MTGQLTRHKLLDTCDGHCGGSAGGRQVPALVLGASGEHSGMEATPCSTNFGFDPDFWTPRDVTEAEETSGTPCPGLSPMEEGVLGGDSGEDAHAEERRELFIYAIPLQKDKVGCFDWWILMGPGGS